MKKTKLDTRRDEFKKRRKENPTIDKKSFLNLIKRASQPLLKQN